MLISINKGRIHKIKCVENKRIDFNKLINTENIELGSYVMITVDMS